MALCFIASLALWGGTVRADTAQCNPSTFTFPSILGVALESIEAETVFNYTLNPNWTPEALSIPGVDGPSFCNVTFTYTRPATDTVIHVQAWLPLSDWNGRFVGVGGGGFATGELGGDHITTLLHQRYAAAATDGGHDHHEFFAAPWALRSPGNTNWEAVTDFAHRSLHDMAIIGRSATADYFGRDPEYSYWRGCSTGGRQGLIVAQRYPEDWDGILATCPAVNMPRIAVGGYWPQFIMNQLKAYPPTCELEAIRQEAIAACDALDGTEDGIIADPDRCGFDAQTVVGQLVKCEGTNETALISAAAAAVANAAWAGPKNVAGESIGFGYPVGTPLTGPIALGNTFCQEGDNGTVCQGAPFPIAPEWIRLFVAKDPDFDPLSMTYEEYEHIMRRSVQEYDGIIGSADADLSEFRRLGRKMITWHGVNDETLTMRSMRAYYDQVLTEDAAAGEFYRYFEAPGVNHCHAAPGSSYPMHGLEALRRWVEEGISPDVLETVRLDETGGGKEGVKGADVCAYPQISRDGRCSRACSSGRDSAKHDL